jgi:hypothetical protein
MELSANMGHTEAVQHLRSTFPLHVKHDVDAAAPFGAIRSIFAGIEYVAALYAGWNGKSGGMIATRRKTVEFLKEVLPAATGVEEYSLFAEHLYDLFRSGTVHLYVPRRLHAQHGVLDAVPQLVCVDWRIDDGRSALPRGRLYSVAPPARCHRGHHRPISLATTLLNDLLAAAGWLASRLEEEAEGGGRTLLDRWRETADGMSRPAKTNLHW